MSALKTIIHITLSLTILICSGQAGTNSNVPVGRAEHFLMKEKIYKTLKIKLPKKYAHYAASVTDTIMKQSSKYKVDPLMITAVIAGESSFNPSVIGPVGEIGLMQLRPATALWIASKAQIRWRGARSLKNPVYNIQIGVAYLSHLQKRFSPKGGVLYLAAYNMGESNLLRLLSNKIEPSLYSTHVMKNYLAINE